MITVQGVKLDDHEINTYFQDLSYGWTQICESCRSKFSEHGIDHNSGHGICGVFGCENDSNHYLDFDKSEVADDQQRIMSYQLELFQTVHCLTCDGVFTENIDQFTIIEKCLYCGNADKQQTVYLEGES